MCCGFKVMKMLTPCPDIKINEIFFTQHFTPPPLNLHTEQISILDRKNTSPSFINKSYIALTVVLEKIALCVEKCWRCLPLFPYMCQQVIGFSKTVAITTITKKLKLKEFYYLYLKLKS